MHSRESGHGENRGMVRIGASHLSLQYWNPECSTLWKLRSEPNSLAGDHGALDQGDKCPRHGTCCVLTS
jgi:hypothetical protein